MVLIRRRRGVYCLSMRKRPHYKRPVRIILGEAYYYVIANLRREEMATCFFAVAVSATVRRQYPDVWGSSRIFLLDQLHLYLPKVVRVLDLHNLANLRFCRGFLAVAGRHDSNSGRHCFKIVVIIAKAICLVM